MSEKNKRIIATVVLVILLAITLILSYSKAIHTALQEITTNFNQNSKVKEYIETNNITLTATVNNYSIYISYITDTSTTYEFTYDNLCLNITIDANETNKEKFNVVYRFLIEAVQTRINNTIEYTELIDNFLNEDNINYDGLFKEKTENRIKYQINITKKLNSRMEDKNANTTHRK